jgi:hypothetical protein
LISIGGFATGPAPTRLIRKAILQLCLELKPEAVALADSLAPPDFILNSALGKSDGEVNLHIIILILLLIKPKWIHRSTRLYKLPSTKTQEFLNDHHGGKKLLPKSYPPNYKYLFFLKHSKWYNLKAKQTICCISQKESLYFTVPLFHLQVPLSIIY